ncbi:MAG: MBL fold metallo-hydrolase [Deltaproteobacteria bacterium]|nr:MBL fold metallo-hydrolase [Deltaproteobacteria bacterium]MBI3075571.1 MBL fold metallo-hydrolase [Deltaproteobacteria bacterium]
MQLHTFVHGPFENNVYVLVDEATREGLLIDPAPESEPVLDFVAREAIAVRRIVNTHAHIDHAFHDALYRERTGGLLTLHKDDVWLLKELPRHAAWFGLFAKDPPEPDHLLQGGEVLEVGGISLSVLHTPGHTPGGICLYVASEGVLFSGDTLFARSIGRTDLPGGDTRALLASIRQKLFTLPDDTVVYPGHGPQTTIADEKHYNPFLKGSPLIVLE